MGPGGPGGGKPGGPMGMMMGGPTEVTVLTTRKEKVTIATELPGRTSAYLVAEVRPQVNGLIQKRLFTEGSDVKEGDLLYQIDPASYQASVDNAEANLVVTQKSFDKSKATLAAAQASLAQQQATLELARTNQQRYERLVKIGAVSASDRDKAVTETKVDEGAVKKRSGASSCK